MRVQCLAQGHISRSVDGAEVKSVALFVFAKRDIIAESLEHLEQVHEDGSPLR